MNKKGHSKLCPFVIVGDFMKIKSLWVLLLISNVAVAQDNQQFIIKNSNRVNSMSKNRLKEEIGNITRQAFNATTRLGKIVGNIRIDLSQKHFDFYQAENGKVAAEVDKNNGALHIELAEIQGCFSDVITNLVENEKFFKKASRGDLREFLTLIETLSDDLNKQVLRFDLLKNMILNENKDANLFKKIKHRFLSSAEELKKIQEKIQGSKCLKKGV